MTSMLYYIIIYPIELLLDIVFHLAHLVSGNPGIAIIVVSFVVNILLLPLYRRADAIQAEEKKRQDAMSGWVSHIKRTFRGDERVMMLSAYYKEQQYHPIYALRSSISLLLQIPFFIAAYHFLSHLSLLTGTSFLMIRDLSLPDALISIGGISINILPILMTLINFVSTIIYTRGSKIKDNIQIYILALLFLVLLYPSPSGLVLYWTMNNIFSLVKNVMMKGSTKDNSLAQEGSSSTKLYLSLITLLVILIGILIPSSVVSSSPQEFVEPTAFKNPTTYILSTFCIAMGCFLLWSSIFYSLASAKIKRHFCFILLLCCCISIVDYFFFGKDLGILSADLTFDTSPTYSITEIILNIFIILALCVIMVFVWKKYQRYVMPASLIIATSLLMLASINMLRIERSISAADYTSQMDASSFTLSKNGRNVIVIMLDRAIGAYIPFVLEERPELKEQFSGFTYYPNTISHGFCTNFGSPGLFGGYEYTPVEMDRRSNETLKDKHDEALLMMPVLFSDFGYKVSVFDPPYAGYEEWPDLSIYEPYQDIKARHLISHFSDPDYYALIEKARRRSFFMYSIFKTFPVAFQPFIYDERKFGLAQYLSADEAYGVPYNFYQEYAVLSNLSDITEITDSNIDTFMMYDNNVTHLSCELQLPNYIPTLTINNVGLEKGYRLDEEGNRLNNVGLYTPDEGGNDETDARYNYYSHIAAMLRIGEWLDYLKENGVYDNTRIIIVADHGFSFGDFPKLILGDGTDMENANPLLLFKDFYSTGFSVSDEFMTNADTPTLATKDIIQKPVNPFTGNAINSNEKYSHPQLVNSSQNSSIHDMGDKTRFDYGKGEWFSIHDNIFNKDNWMKLGSVR